MFHPWHGRGEPYLYIAGWKEVSLVDIIGASSFTIWTGYCNLRCPWCSNAAIVRGRGVKRVSIGKIVAEVLHAAPLIDYLHVTGGEPVLQAYALIELFRRIRGESRDLMISVNTNGTLPAPLRKLVDMLDHIAIDVKAPLSMPQLYSKVTGTTAELSKHIVRQVAKSIRISTRVPFLELRTTLVPGLISKREVALIAAEIAELTKNAKCRIAYVVQQFIPYEGVENEYYRSQPSTPLDTLFECAKEAAQLLDCEVYVRCIERGTVKIR